jgi:hypothetical protein
MKKGLSSKSLAVTLEAQTYGLTGSNKGRLDIKNSLTRGSEGRLGIKKAGKNPRFFSY